ncbi:MAG: sugar phosphate isomerase/epimerase [Planctomycetota bacterium]|nr:sugar phosphate isomerase/epimerase [Planctomycetota bacterium]
MVGAMSRRQFLAMVGVGAAAGTLAAGRIWGAEAGKTKGIRIGVCTGPENAALLKEAGCDYVEAAARSFLKPDEAEWTPPGDLGSLALRIEAYNSFLPGDLKITGPAVDLERLKTYVTRACERAKRVGSSIIVWGSGGSRKIPDGWDRAKAEEQYVAALGLAGPIAAAQGLTLALEPLPTRETNIANTTVEAMGYIRKAGAEGIALMVDLRHFTTMNEPLENLDACKNLLVHSHVGDPLSNPDRLKQQLGRLKANGYAARMSIEGGVKDLKNGLKPAMEVLRRTWAEA